MTFENSQSTLQSLMGRMPDEVKEKNGNILWVELGEVKYVARTSRGIIGVWLISELS